MRYLHRLAWAAVVVAFAASSCLAQQPVAAPTGGTGGGGTTATPTTSGTGTAGGGGQGGGGGQAGSGFGAPALIQIEEPPQITGVSLYQSTQGATGQGASPSNVLGGTYANPLFQGRRGATVNQGPGGFGAPLYTTTGAGGAGGAGGRAGGLTGLGGAGGRGAAGGFLGGAATGGNQSGVVVQMPRAIAYAAQVRFPAPAVAPVRLQTDLRGIIDRTTMLANPGNIQFQVDGTTVVLRGSVKDAEEARLVEGLVRLTPGVRLIQNQLTFPAQ